MLSSLTEFDVREACCYDADRDLLLRAIESGYSSLSRFNDDMRKALTAAYQITHSRDWRAGASVRRRRCGKTLWKDVMDVAWRDLDSLKTDCTPEIAKVVPVAADPVPVPVAATVADFAPAVPAPLPVPLSARLPARLPARALPAPLLAAVRVSARVAPSSNQIRGTVLNLQHRNA